MILGTAYYPEHWEKKRWGQDAALMQKMGINTVRMGEFGWSVMEREEGKYDFSLYDEAIAVMAKAGISTILGTPTAAPPAWLCEKYSDIYMRDKQGRKRGFGSRRHYCYNHKGYRQEAARITAAMAVHFKENPHIIAWQIDNELGCEDEVRCYCENCRKAFIGWLQKKYSALERLNREWGTVFWSQTYTGWEQIVLPKETVIDGYTGYGHNPGLLLDFARFSSDSMIEFAKGQRDILKQSSPKPVVHNIVSEYCDNYRLSELLDGAGYDAYPRSEWDDNSPSRIGFHYDLTRGYKEAPFWILEQQSGPCGWNVLGKTPRKGQLKLWSMQGAARGAASLVYFRWRTCPFGTEQFWYGILDHDGIPGERYEELKETVSEIRKQEKIFSLPNQKQALLVYDYENKFSCEFQPRAKGFAYKEEVIRYYEALMDCHLAVDVGGICTDPGPYEMAVLPFCCMMERKVLENYESYVKKGGILVLTPFAGLRNPNNQITESTLPGIWREMAGVSVTGFYAVPEGEKIASELGQIRLWYDVLKAETAQSISRFENEQGKLPAVTVHSYGKGKVYTISAFYESYTKVMSMILDRERIAGYSLPKEVECIVKQEGEYLILLNHSSTETRITVPGYREPETGNQSFAFSGYSCLILEKSREASE